ncbi:ISNCY family transposase [Caldalkalibacillus thermarum TA2.A1]|uniref:ISNCY family transposase n=1 Tax=Caldalkalibacillus thermarum (strain TA2.A1) TaxID=986075 RepID=A0A8X8IC66_CALTT|nr:ISNCY family transposase [Caldalkalibacillus thermarum]QZT32852.1 ISNCY family transposase [Caldalkalibacillus thermarum TA2.A1]QZT34760.1 ISNCY family transposase [Caldalkalibacillus thermarum TA2.A1]
MSKKELMRYKVVSRWIDGLITGSEAAELLNLSYRQVCRLKKRILEEGESGVIHKNKGRKPAHALDDEVRQRILELHQSERYKNCNDVHFAELLAKYEGIEVSPSTVRRIRLAARIKAKRKRRPSKAHRPRKRKPQAGMLVQMDGSFHRWLEDRAEPMCLLAAIDDATGRIVAAVFRPQEDTEGYFLLTRQMIEREGIPMSIYSDRHMIFRSPHDKLTIEQELAGESKPLSQFGQALRDLGIEHIQAHTPQAKGRIERLFETLQDRWIVELRLRGVDSIEEANRVLPELIEEHNKAFAVEPTDPHSAFVPLEQNQPDLDLILCYRHWRTLGTGQTLSFDHKTYAIAEGSQKSVIPPIPPKTRVEVRQTLDGRLFVWYKGKAYALKEIPKPKRQAAPSKQKAGSERKPHKPDENHPWRKPLFNPKEAPETARCSQTAPS